QFKIKSNGLSRRRSIQKRLPLVLDPLRKPQIDQAPRALPKCDIRADHAPATGASGGFRSHNAHGLNIDTTAIAPSSYSGIFTAHVTFSAVGCPARAPRPA